MKNLLYITLLCAAVLSMGCLGPPQEECGINNFSYPDSDNDDLWEERVLVIGDSLFDFLPPEPPCSTGDRISLQLMERIKDPSQSGARVGRVATEVDEEGNDVGSPGMIDSGPAPYQTEYILRQYEQAQDPAYGHDPDFDYDVVIIDGGANDFNDPVSPSIGGVFDLDDKGCDCEHYMDANTYDLLSEEDQGGIKRMSDTPEGGMVAKCDLFVEKIADNMKSTIEHIKDQSGPDVEVVLVGYEQVEFSKYIGHCVHRFLPNLMDLYRKYADDQVGENPDGHDSQPRVHFVDMDFLDQPLPLLYDGHPDADGVRILADAVVDLIQERELLPLSTTAQALSLSSNDIQSNSDLLTVWIGYEEYIVDLLLNEQPEIMTCNPGVSECQGFVCEDLGDYTTSSDCENAGFAWVGWETSYNANTGEVSVEVESHSFPFGGSVVDGSMVSNLGADLNSSRTLTTEGLTSGSPVSITGLASGTVSANVVVEGGQRTLGYYEVNCQNSGCTGNTELILANSREVLSCSFDQNTYDTDCDGIGNDYEKILGTGYTDAMGASDMPDDTDGDGVPNALEGLNANLCTGSFQAGLQTHDAAGVLHFNIGSSYDATNSDAIRTHQITKTSTSDLNCTVQGQSTPQECTATEKPAYTLSLPAFEYSSSNSYNYIFSRQSKVYGGPGWTEFGTIVVGNSASVELLPSNGGHYKITSLSTSAGAEIKLAAGDYWVKNLSLNSSAKISVTTPGTVRLFIENFQYMGASTELNSAGLPENLVIFSYGDFPVANSSVFNGYIYSLGRIGSSGTTNYQGSINGGSIVIGTNGQFTQDTASIANVDFGEVCDIDNDGIYDGVDGDQDGDGTSDDDEDANGTDPRDPSS